MTDQGGALAEPLPTEGEVLAAIERYGYLRANLKTPEALAVLEGISDLLSDIYDALSAVEARLEEYRRFVRAWDEWEHLSRLGDAGLDQERYDAVKAARAAIRDEGLTE